MTLLQTGAPQGALPLTPVHDSTLVVQTPDGFKMPGGMSVLTRSIFDRPQEVQWAALSVGVLLFALVAYLGVRHRVQVVHWLRTRSRAMTVALGSVAAVAVVGFGVAGWSGYQMMEHDNAFCTSCHLMDPEFARFYQTKHRRLECHDCHKQSMFADMKELQHWVFQRPAKIPPHPNAVPNELCEGCHFSGHKPVGLAANDPAVKGARLVDKTVGHVVHLRSQQRPGITCTQCHARPTPHVFVPSNETCLQAGCHDDIRIRLGKMRQVKGLKCTGCHDFLRPVGTIKPPFQKAERKIVPVRKQCLSCHAMEQRVKGQSFANDPHRQQCGLCHNPHRQTTPAAAVASCSSDGCHTQVTKLSPYHVGLPPAALARCTLCHTPHTWKARSKVCSDCHTNPDAPLQGMAGGIEGAAALKAHLLLQGTLSHASAAPGQPAAAGHPAAAHGASSVHPAAAVGRGR